MQEYIGTTANQSQPNAPYAENSHHFEECARESVMELKGATRAYLRLVLVVITNVIYTYGNDITSI